MKFEGCRAVIAAIIIVSTMHYPLLGQEQSGASPESFSILVDRAYGQDQELVNGMQYYNRHPRSMGHPYLLEGWTHSGSVRLRGKLYTDVWIRYDIHSQQIEIEYQTINGADNQVVLVWDRVDEFTIEHRHFQSLELEDEAKFYQVIGNDHLICYIQWEKKLVPVSGDSRFLEEYTDPKRSYLLQMDGLVAPFHNKSSFVKLFPENLQKQVKKLIRANQLTIRTATSEQLELFMLAASKLLKEGMHP